MLKAGQFVFVRYQGHPVWHERLVLGAAANSNSRYVIATPDADMYFEEFGTGNEDINGFKRAAGDRVPSGIEQGQAYRFRNRPGGTQLTDLIAQARELILEDNARNFDCSWPEDSRFWVALENNGGLKRGDRVQLSADAVVLENRGVTVKEFGGHMVHIAVGRVDEDELKVLTKTNEVEVEDARTLAIKSTGGRRFREFKEAVELMSEQSFADWPVTGPRTVQWCLQFLIKKGGPLAHHQWWLSVTRLSLSDAGVGEHENAMRCLEEAVCYDQCDVMNVAAFEHVVRKAQLWEHFYREKARVELASSKDKSLIDLEEQNMFMGTTGAEGCLMIAPMLTSWVSAELEKVANIDKQSRKAREERALRRKA